MQIEHSIVCIVFLKVIFTLKLRDFCLFCVPSIPAWSVSDDHCCRIRVYCYSFIHRALLTSFNCIFVDLTHTADIQFHSWGNNLVESFEQSAYALYDYMTNRSMLPEQSTLSETIAVQGDDPTELLYNFLDELLFKFHTKPFPVAVQ